MATKENALRKLPENVDKELIFSVLQKERVITSTLKVEKIAASRFFSSLYLIEAQSSTNNFLSFYVKCLLEDPKIVEVTKSTLQFQNEIALYQKILPAFKQFQKENSPEELRPPLSIPLCYAAEGTGKNYVVILKDMCTSGFVLLDRLKPMELPEIELALKQIGRFHGFSLAMKIKVPEEFKKLIEHLVEPVYDSPQYEDFYRKAMAYCMDGIRSMLNDYYEEESIYLKKFIQFMKTSLNIIPSQVLRDQTNEPYNVITHGDIWICNMLFHYGKNRSKPDDVCFLDFQQMRYCSPAIDLSRFLFVIMDKATRGHHGDYLLRCYHDTLCQTLGQFNLNHEDLFPFSEMESQLKKCSAFIVILTIFTLTLSMYTDEDEYSVNEENPFSNIKQTLSSECRKRIFEVIEEFVERGYMDIGSCSDID